MTKQPQNMKLNSISAETNHPRRSAAPKTEHRLRSRNMQRKYFGLRIVMVITLLVQAAHASSITDVWNLVEICYKAASKLPLENAESAELKEIAIPSSVWNDGTNKSNGEGTGNSANGTYTPTSQPTYFVVTSHKNDANGTNFKVYSGKGTHAERETFPIRDSIGFTTVQVMVGGTNKMPDSIAITQIGDVLSDSIDITGGTRAGQYRIKTATEDATFIMVEGTVYKKNEDGIFERDNTAISGSSGEGTPFCIVLVGSKKYVISPTVKVGTTVHTTEDRNIFIVQNGTDVYIIHHEQDGTGFIGTRLQFEAGTRGLFSIHSNGKKLLKLDLFAFLKTINRTTELTMTLDVWDGIIKKTKPIIDAIFN